MYQSIFYDSEEQQIHLWDDENGYTKERYKPYGYIKDDKGDFTHLYGFKVKKTYNLESRPFEFDVPATTRVLIDKYSTSNELSKDISILYFDIEVEKGEDGYSTTEEAKNKINAISFYSNKEKITYVLLLDETNTIQNKDIEKRILKVFKTEETLLKYFLIKYKQYEPNILVGWNSDIFDIPYIYNRLTKLFSEEFASKLSPINIVKLGHVSEQGATYRIAGVSSYDYMNIYKRFTYGEEPSYSLESISQKELGRGKIKYEGDLTVLYKKDINKFIEYSATDVELMVDMDAKLDYIGLARSICHKGHVPYDDIFMTSKVLEGASLTYMKLNNLVAPNKPKRIKLSFDKNHYIGDDKLSMKDKIDQRIPGSGRLTINKTKTSVFVVEYTNYDGNTFYLKEPLTQNIKQEFEVRLNLIGAYVQDPELGKHKWVFDIDLTSLYPSIIRTLNISPETKYGRIIDWNLNDYLKNTDRKFTIKIKDSKKEISNEKLHLLINKNKLSFSATGVLYTQDKVGFIPTILGVWFNERVEFKNLMKAAGNVGDEEKKKYYHNLQLVVKTLLNSFYGVLALNSFRFYDIDNAESVTGSGQQIIKFSANSANRKFNSLLEIKENINHVKYIDTDSIFCSVVPLFKKFYPNLELNYKPAKDERLKEDKYIDIEKWEGKYNWWIKEFIAEAINNKFLNKENIFFNKEKHQFESKETIIPIYKLQGFILNKYSPQLAFKEFNIINKTLGFAKQIQVHINKDYDDYVKRYHNVIGTHYLDIKQEFISRSAMWIAKKRYAMWIVDNEGIPVNKLDVKGLDIVRSDFPKALQSFLKEVTIDLLNDYTKEELTKNIIGFRDNLKNENIENLLGPKSVKRVKQYEEQLKKVPINVKSALNYNKLLKIFNDGDTIPINDGDKIKWGYLKSNPYKFDTIAIKGFDDNQQIIEFVKNYIDIERVFDNNLLEKLNDYFIANNWGEINFNQTKLTKFFK